MSISYMGLRGPVPLWRVCHIMVTWLPGGTKAILSCVSTGTLSGGAVATGVGDAVGRCVGGGVDGIAVAVEAAVAAVVGLGVVAGARVAVACWAGAAVGAV